MSAPPATSPLKANAYAKINLYLHVIGRRDDGYHELDSLVAFAELSDTLTVRSADVLELEISGPFAAALSPDGEDNLVLKAARALAKHVGRVPRAHITLGKNLPVSSGIGGGSADAAAVLRLLDELWGLSLDDDILRRSARKLSENADGARTLKALFALWRDELNDAMLHRVGLALGADVPACLLGRTVFMGGIGEKLDLAPALPPSWVVLVNPALGVSTPAVFQSRTGEYSSAKRFSIAPRDTEELAQVLRERRNDLSTPALAIAPPIGDVLAALEALHGALLARMSGSGATCFALFAHESEARIAAAHLRRKHTDWWVAAARLVEPGLDLIQTSRTD